MRALVCSCARLYVVFSGCVLAAASADCKSDDDKPLQMPHRLWDRAVATDITHLCCATYSTPHQILLSMFAFDWKHFIPKGDLKTMKTVVLKWLLEQMLLFQ